MSPNPNTSSIEIRQATLNHLPSLTTIFPRSFHPTNPFMKQALPDTPSIRTWWSRVFTEEITSPHCHTLIAVDPTRQEEEEEAVLGILCQRLMQPADPPTSAGLWTQTPFTPSHDATLLQPAIDVQIRGRAAAFAAAVPHILIELFGVDHAYTGRGVGRRLLERACGIADAEGLDVFVEANAVAAVVYAKWGFEDLGAVDVPGLDGGVYAEHCMVRWRR
jgi:GNAT superfamily N-acetyltransferase